MVLKKIQEKYGDVVQLVMMDQRDLENPIKLHGRQNRHVLESEGNYEQIKEQFYEHLEQLKHEGRISKAGEIQARGSSGENWLRVHGSLDNVEKQSRTGSSDYSSHGREARGSSQNRRILRIDEERDEPSR